MKRKETPLAVLVEKLRTNMHYCEYSMTKKGFTNGDSHYYDPSDLTMVSMYSFPNEARTDEISFLYILRDKKGVLGFCIDAFGDFEVNEANLFHWFLAKVAKHPNTD